MKLSSTLLPCLAILLNSIGMCSQSRRSRDESQHPDSSQQAAEGTDRARSRSPTLRRTFPGVLGYRFEDLEFIRLRPYCSPNRVFELRTYVFPQDKPIGVRTRPGILKPIPAGERIVLSTSNGDVCAMMDKRDNKHIVLRAICIYVAGKSERAKINMDTGVLKKLTKYESDGCPASTQDQIAKNYAIFRADTAIPNTGSSVQSRGRPDVGLDSDVHHSGPSPSSSRNLPDTTQSFAISHPSTVSRTPTLSETFPTILGYKFKDLKSIRMTPHEYPNRIFKLRIYAFPRDKPIGLRTKNHILDSMPTGDQIVLSTSDGDVYAILQRKLNKGTIIRPIFTSNLGNLKRVKINIHSEEVEEISTEENAECPFAFKEVITKSYKVYHV